MSANLTPTFQVQQFSTNLALLLQQKVSKLAGCVTIGNYVGKQGSPVDQMGAVAASKVGTKFSPITRTDAITDRRWCFPSDYELAQYIDSLDKLRMIVDPQSAEVQNALNAMNRAKDDEIISAFFGTAKTGETGAVSTTLPSSQIVNVGVGSTGASGFNVAKLRAARQILMQNEVDLESDPVFAIVKAKQHDNLLAEAQIISSDFNGEAPVLVDGMVTRFLGINIIRCERLPAGTDDLSGSSDAIPVFAKSGMHLGMWNDIMTDITIRKDMTSLPTQIYTMGSFGATRLEEKKMVKVWCR